MLLGLWPYVMRRTISLWSDAEYSSFSVAIVVDRIVGTLSICTSMGISSYVVFSFNYAQDWKQRVVTWFVNLLCCTVGEVSSVGLNCGLLPRLECLTIADWSSHAFCFIFCKKNKVLSVGI